MDISYDTLSDMQLDVLREIGNIGAGNAATSLSTLLNRPVDMDIPVVHLVEFKKAARILDSPEALSFGVILTLDGDINGMMLFLLDTYFARETLRALMGIEYPTFKTVEDVDDMALSALKEVGNILCAAYIRSINELTGLSIGMSIPDAAVDMAGALISFPLIRFGASGNKAFCIEENFKLGEASVKSHIILFAELESLNMMLGKLGLN